MAVLREAPVPGWSRLARSFHWLTLILIIVQIPLGFWMVEVYEVYAETYTDDTWVMRTSLLHHTLGFLILGISFARFGWRMSHPTPGLPVNLVSYQRWLAHLTHISLYLLLFIYPFSGWASLSAYEGEFPIFFFGWNSVPGIVPQASEGAFFSYEFFAGVHRYCWRVGAAILGLHVVGAMWHQFVVKDGVLRRMWAGS